MTDRPARVEVRLAHVSDVRYPERIIDLIAVPYDEWATVEYEGRLVQESFRPGAFGNVQNRSDKFLVNLEHDFTRVVGKVHRLYPDHPKGLRSELFIRRGEEFDQVLLDAADGMLDGSVGFGVYPENQEWEGKERRRIVKAKLDHIALTFTPAFAGAKVVGVRTTPPPPAASYLERIRLRRLAEEYHL